MNKAYIVHYVGYDYKDTDRGVSERFYYDLPDEMYPNYEDAVRKFEEMIADELQNWDLDCAELERTEELFYIREDSPERWTEIQIKCLTIKE